MIWIIVLLAVLAIVLAVWSITKNSPAALVIAVAFVAIAVIILAAMTMPHLRL